LKAPGTGRQETFNTSFFQNLPTYESKTQEKDFGFRIPEKALLYENLN
jgi:hypothetical protein